MADVIDVERVSVGPAVHIGEGIVIAPPKRPAHSATGTGFRGEAEAMLNTEKETTLL